MAERREDLRAADVDRQFVAERLKAAVDEGRLSLSEYDERLREAYAAKTYGELDQVLVDLPGFVPVSDSQVLPAQTVYPTAEARKEISGSPLRAIPPWLLGIWSAWLVAVSINVVIWFLVSVSSDDGPVYFWPMWVAGPWGAVLLATTISTHLAGGPEREVERRAERRRVHRDARRRDRD